MTESAAKLAGAGTVSPWVERFLHGIKAGGRVLDVACGSGRHLRLAHVAGYTVTGVDRDLSGVADLSGSERVRFVKADLEAGGLDPLRDHLGGETFDGVIVTNYLWRPILPDIVARVAVGGALIYETFAVGNERVGRRKPSNPDFLLKPGELLETIRPALVAIAYEHVSLCTETLGASLPARVVQRIVAVGPEHPWVTIPPLSMQS